MARRRQGGKADSPAAAATAAVTSPKDSPSKRKVSASPRDPGKRRRVKAETGFPPRENGAVGLPNSSGSDCFWISALQCIRHAPGYVESVREHLASTPEGSPASPKRTSNGRGRDEGPTDLLRATAQLMNAMDSTNELQSLPARSVALESFRSSCSEALSVKLVETRLRRQVQQDVHELLLQLVQALSQSVAPDGAAQASPVVPEPPDSVDNETAPVTDELRQDLAEAHATGDT